MKQRVFLLGGRTGGPLIPSLAVCQGIEADDVFICGIKGGFEEKIAQEKGYTFLILPEAKLRLNSFKNQSVSQKIQNILDLIVSSILLSISILKCLYFLIKFRPTLVISAGSFLNIPMGFSINLLKTITIKAPKLIIHQQDPLPGLSNIYVASKADILTCVFESTKKFKEFTRAEIIPNPFNFDLFSEENLSKLEQKTHVFDEDLANFINRNDKPLFLIFGGGSGSEFINNWVVLNIHALTQSFNVLHLTGHYQKNQKETGIIKDYYVVDTLTDLMPLVQWKADLVLCRSGMGSITEFLNIQKPVFLVPIPDSHQEANAKEVSDFFFILEQKDSDDWVSIITTSYPDWFKKIKYPSQEDTQTMLTNYYNKIKWL